MFHTCTHGKAPPCPPPLQNQSKPPPRPGVYSYIEEEGEIIGMISWVLLASCFTRVGRSPRAKLPIWEVKGEEEEEVVKEETEDG